MQEWCGWRWGSPPGAPVPACPRVAGHARGRRVGSYILARVLGGRGGVGSLQATPPAAGGGREVRGSWHGAGCARESEWSVGCENECQG